MNHFSLTDGLLVSILGFLVVFIVLLALALFTVLIGKIMQRLEQAHQPEISAPAAVLPDAQADEMEEVLAILHSVLSQESGISSDQLLITSVTRMD